MRRALRRAWRMMTWPLSSHIVFALATGLVCGIAASGYPDVIAPPYAAIVGTLMIYSLLLLIWLRVNRSGGSGR